MLRGNGWIRSRQIFSNAFSTRQYRAGSFPGGCVAGWITYPIYICTLCVSSERKPAKHADERSYPGGTCVSLLTASVRPTPTNVAVQSEIVCLFWPQLLNMKRCLLNVEKFVKKNLCVCSDRQCLGILCVSSDRKCSHRVDQVVPHCWSERVLQKHGRQKKSVVWS